MIMFIFIPDLVHKKEQSAATRCKHPNWMLDWMVSVKLDLCVMIGNQRVNMADYMIQRCHWRMVMNTRSTYGPTCAHTQTKYIQMHTSSNACATIPYVHRNGRNKRVEFVWPSPYPLIWLRAFSAGPPLPVNALLFLPVMATLCIHGLQTTERHVMESDEKKLKMEWLVMY